MAELVNQEFEKLPMQGSLPSDLKVEIGKKETMNQKVLEKIQKVLTEDKVTWLHDSTVEKKAQEIMSLFIGLLQERLDEIEHPEDLHPELHGIEATMHYLRGLPWGGELIDELNKLEAEGFLQSPA